VLFRPLPFDDPEELAFVVARSLALGPDFNDCQTHSTRFEGFAGTVALPGTLTGAGPPERITNAHVTWNLLSLLGVQPVLGRNQVVDDAFAIDPQQFGNPDPKLPPGKVVLSYGLWQRRFGGDSSVIGGAVTPRPITQPGRQQDPRRCRARPCRDRGRTPVRGHGGDAARPAPEGLADPSILFTLENIWHAVSYWAPLNRSSSSR
jgi:hypothetical protein